MVVRFLVPRGSGIKFAQYVNCCAWLKLMTEVADQCRCSVRIWITGYGYVFNISCRSYYCGFRNNSGMRTVFARNFIHALNQVKTTASFQIQLVL